MELNFSIRLLKGYINVEAKEHEQFQEGLLVTVENSFKRECTVIRTSKNR